MNLLNRKLIEDKKLLSGEELAAIERMPEKILQFGEGKFLRGFIDWMVSAANRQGVFEGRVVIVSPRRDHLVDVINEQDGFFTMLSRGKEKGETVDRREIVASVSRAVSPRLQWPELLACLEQPQLKVVVSNTTEAGICHREEPGPGKEICPETFPAKLTALLYHRFCHFRGEPGSGMLILPCELIEDNGRILREIVMRYAFDWNLPSSFKEWLKSENLFLNTLVDRIVTGVAEEEQENIWRELGYRDRLLNAGEVFHQFFIETAPGAEELFPLHRANLHVKWVDNLTPYRTRKVRLLNGAHTSTMPLALLQGLPTVRDAVGDRLTRQFMEHVLFTEVIPATAGNGADHSDEDLRKFAAATLERFDNPFIDHYWQDISINSVAKFKTRILPSFLDYLKHKGNLPEAMTFSLAALLVLYRGEKPCGEGMKFSGPDPFYLKEDTDVLEIFYREWAAAGKSNSSGDLIKVARNLLKNSRLWERDLNSVPGLPEKVAGHLKTILNDGIREAMLTVQG